MTKRNRKISDEAVLEATGKPWKEWFGWLDAEGARDLPHREIAKRVRQQVENGWWAQTIAVEYEYEHGKRTLGSTADAGYQVGVQRTIPLPREKVWRLLTSRDGLPIWLGDVKELPLRKRATYETGDGTHGEVRSIDSGKKLRLTWAPPFLRTSSTLQIYLECSRNDDDKTTVRFHQEKLSSDKERERMKEHWKSVLGDLHDASLHQS